MSNPEEDDDPARELEDFSALYDRIQPEQFSGEVLDEIRRAARRSSRAGRRRRLLSRMTDAFSLTRVSVTTANLVLGALMGIGGVTLFEAFEEKRIPSIAFEISEPRTKQLYEEYSNLDEPSVSVPAGMKSELRQDELLNFVEKLERTRVSLTKLLQQLESEEEIEISGKLKALLKEMDEIIERAKIILSSKGIASKRNDD